ncbi:unnamed protein product [Prorocentrum cordatum]|uniref:Uncharacterized protein n=1 Tax=Prorocentrum cordatum TaxID=2364126 RepID=A0ABN9UV12_9DINO|nr:unnamed protein product [Polarella glacialis]
MAKSRESGGFNAHYDLQHGFCGARNLSEYDFVGVLAGSPANIHRQVKRMLEVHARVLPRAKIMHLSDQLFPTSTKAGHGTNTVDLMKTFYQNRTILRLVMHQYAEDYAWASPTVRAAWAQARRAVGLEPQAARPGASAAATAQSPHRMTRKERYIKERNRQRAEKRRAEMAGSRSAPHSAHATTSAEAQAGRRLA